MSYRHIKNLYASKDILLFKQCYAMEKLNGTSAHIKYNQAEDKLTFFHGGANRDLFLALFNQEELLAKFRENAKEFIETKNITIYGEAYGGKLQKMAHTYGLNLKFCAFEVQINEEWLSVPRAEKIAQKFGLDFVYYEIIDATEEAINKAMMSDSVQAVKNGMGIGHIREGIVLRPIIEIVHPSVNSGGEGRILAKHKRPEFAERQNTPKFADPEQLKVFEKANEIAEEWCVGERLLHVLDSLGLTNPQIEDSNKVINGMIEDVIRESAGEIVESKEARKAIGKKTMKLFKEYLRKY